MAARPLRHADVAHVAGEPGGRVAPQSVGVLLRPLEELLDARRVAARVAQPLPGTTEEALAARPHPPTSPPRSRPATAGRGLLVVVVGLAAALDVGGASELAVDAGDALDLAL